MEEQSRRREREMKPIVPTPLHNLPSPISRLHPQNGGTTPRMMVKKLKKQRLHWFCIYIFAFYHIFLIHTETDHYSLSTDKLTYPHFKQGRELDHQQQGQKPPHQYSSQILQKHSFYYYVFSSSLSSLLLLLLPLQPVAFHIAAF